MAGTIDMQFMRYINLFSKVSRVSTTNCFIYNYQIVFGVPKAFVSKAIGKDAENVKKLKGILRKNIRVVAMPSKESITGIQKFIADVVAPIEFNKVEINGTSAVITAGRQSKAALIGRNRAREKELGSVLKNYFGITRFRVA